MKKIFTLLLGVFITFGALFAAPKTVLYLSNAANPFATGDNANDQIMFDLIESLGYIVTAEVIDLDGTDGTYDVAFTSEAIQSGDGGWKGGPPDNPNGWRIAPIPMVMAKVWAIKNTALNWIETENNPDDYGNSPDTIFVAVDDEHPITTGLPDPLQVIENSGEGDNGAYVNASDFPSGANVVYSTQEGGEAEATVVAIDAGTTLNTHQLENNVVILGIHQVAYDALAENTAKLIDNCLKWAMGEDINDPDAIDDNDLVNTTVYPNPSTGMVNVRFDQFITSAQLTITALDGRTIRTNDIYNAESVSLDLSDLTSGIYIMNIRGKDINYTQSISLQY
jgi:hypothetical protein